MCIAILASKGKSLTDAQVDACWKANPHGAGFVYSRNGELVFVKELVNKDKWLRLYRKHLPLAVDSPMLIHFRVRTHGEISIANTQPIQIDKNTAFIHNGMINCVPDHKVHSDTVMFSKMVLRRLKPGFHFHLKVLDMIDKVVGFSKLAFLSADKKWGIVGEKSGNWEDGIWYSNGSHRAWVEKKKDTSIVVTGGRWDENNVWRGHGYHSDAGAQTVLAPTRLLGVPIPPVESKVVVNGVRHIVGRSLPYMEGMRCEGCDGVFNQGDWWYEYCEKHIVCSSCKSDWESAGVHPSVSGIITAPITSLDENELFERAYGCGI